MRRYFVELGCAVKASSSEQLEEHILAVMDALLEEPGVIDPDVCAELATGGIRLSLYIDAATDGEALEGALVRIRSAVHAAEGFTTGWPGRKDIELEEGFEASVRPADFAST